MKNKRILEKILVYAGLIIVGFVMIGPFLWLVMASLMPGANIYADPLTFMKQLVTQFSIANYVDVWQYLDFPRYFLNTIIIVGLSVGANVFFSCLTAYPLAVYKFPGRDVVFKLLIATMIIPASAGLIVNYLTIKKLGLLNNYLGVTIVTFCTVFNVFLMRQAYQSVPAEIRESGRIDGASEFRVWWKLVLPTVRPTITVVALFSFMAQWNEFLWPIIVMEKTTNYPLASALTMLNSSLTYDFGKLAAGTVISIVPMITVFLLMQKYFVDGMSGAVKG